MKTIYAACLSRLGLSQAEAAGIHSVRLDTVKSWSSGRNPVPPGAWDDLREYERRIVDRAEEIREVWEDAGEIPQIDATWADKRGLMSLADLVLNAPVVPK